MHTPMHARKHMHMQTHTHTHTHMHMHNMCYLSRSDSAASAGKDARIKQLRAKTATLCGVAAKDVECKLSENEFRTQVCCPLLKPGVIFNAVIDATPTLTHDEETCHEIKEEVVRVCIHCLGVSLTVNPTSCAKRCVYHRNITILTMWFRFFYVTAWQISPMAQSPPG